MGTSPQSPPLLLTNLPAHSAMVVVKKVMPKSPSAQARSCKHLLAPIFHKLITVVYYRHSVGSFPTNPVFGLDGGVYNAASAINWARKIGLFDSFDELGDFRAESAIKRGLAFVPALSGLGCPYWDRSAAGLWAGLSLDTDKKDMMQSVLEGIAARSAEVIFAMEKFHR